MTREEAAELLGLPATATADDARRAWKKLAPKVHPDHGGTNAMFDLLTEAKETLEGNPRPSRTPPPPPPPTPSTPGATSTDGTSGYQSYTWSDPQHDSDDHSDYMYGDEDEWVTVNDTPHATGTRTTAGTEEPHYGNTPPTHETTPHRNRKGRTEPQHCVDNPTQHDTVLPIEHPQVSSGTPVREVC